MATLSYAQPQAREAVIEAQRAQAGGAAKAETHGSAALNAVVAGGIPAQRTSLAALLDRFPLVTGAAGPAGAI